MKLMEEKILREGRILPGEVLKVGSFLNQNIEASGIAIEKCFPELATSCVRRACTSRRWP